MAEYEKAFKRGWFGIILLVMIFLAYLFGTADHWQNLFRDSWHGWQTFREYFTGEKSLSADIRFWLGGQVTSAHNAVESLAEPEGPQWESGWDESAPVPTTQLSDEEKAEILRNRDQEIDLENPSPSAIKFLLVQLSVGSDPAKRAAAGALRDTGRVDVVLPMLVTVTGNSLNDRYTCEAVADLLSRHPQEVQRRVLVQGLYGLPQPLPSACNYQLGTVFKTQGGESKDFLLECLEKGRDRVRAFGLRSLTEKFPDDARARVLALLSDPSSRVRLEAVQSVAYLEMTRNIADLEPLMADPDPRVAAAAQRVVEVMKRM